MNQSPPYLLAIDTVGQWCGVALLDLTTGSIEHTSVLDQPNMHDAMLAEMIQQTILDTRTTTQNIKAIAVSEGPGSFTGVRIGMALAKGWCADRSTTLLSVPTFDAMIHSFVKRYAQHSQSKISIIMKSHGDSWFVQTVDIGSAHTSDISLVSQHELPSFVEQSNIIIGDFPQDSTKQQYPEFTHSHPTYIAELGYHMFLNGQSIDPAMADSRYHAAFIPTMKENS